MSRKTKHMHVQKHTWMDVRLYLRYMALDHSDNERGNPVPPLHGLLFPISSKECFICTISQTG